MDRELWSNVTHTWRATRQPADSVNQRILFEEQSCQISSRSDLNTRALRCYEEGHYNEKKKKQQQDN